MKHTESITPQAGDLLVIVGTVKGVFIFSTNRERSRFKVAGPWLKGQSIYSIAHLADRRAPRILVGNFSMHWGAVVSWSEDLGATRIEPGDGNVKFPRAADSP
jgi:hypothetical protein